MDLLLRGVFPRDLAFKLRPHSMGKELTDQLQACAVKLNQMAESLQSKVREKRNKNKHYRDLLAQAILYKQHLVSGIAN